MKSHLCAHWQRNAIVVKMHLRNLQSQASPQLRRRERRGGKESDEVNIKKKCSAIMVKAYLYDKQDGLCNSG